MGSLDFGRHFGTVIFIRENFQKVQQSRGKKGRKHDVDREEFPLVRSLLLNPSKLHVRPLA